MVLSFWRNVHRTSWLKRHLLLRFVYDSVLAWRRRQQCTLCLKKHNFNVLAPVLIIFSRTVVGRVSYRRVIYFPSHLLISLHSLTKHGYTKFLRWHHILPCNSLLRQQHLCRKLSKSVDAHQSWCCFWTQCSVGSVVRASWTRSQGLCSENVSVRPLVSHARARCLSWSSR